MDSPTRYAGVDWASRAHAICIVDEHGEPREDKKEEEKEPSAAGPGEVGQRPAVALDAQRERLGRQQEQIICLSQVIYHITHHAYASHSEPGAPNHLVATTAESRRR